MAKGTVYLIRHGMTECNKMKSFQGAQDHPLNADGLNQAKELAKHFQNIALDSIYASTMTRARQTAGELAKVKNLPVEFSDAFREISFGDWEGLEYAEITKRWPEEFGQFMTCPSRCHIPHAASFEEVKQRVWQEFQRILLKEGGGRNIAIVAHGGCLRLLLCALLGMPIDNMWMLSLGNCSVTTLEFWDGRCVMTGFNDAKFLTQISLFP